MLLLRHGAVVGLHYIVMKADNLSPIVSVFGLFWAGCFFCTRVPKIWDTWIYD